MKVETSTDTDYAHLHAGDIFTSKVVPTGVDWSTLVRTPNKVTFNDSRNTATTFFLQPSLIFSTSDGSSVTRGYREDIKPAELSRTTLSRQLNLNDRLQEFRRIARSDTLEYGAVSKCDDLILKWFSQSSGELGGIINHIFLQSMSDKNVLLYLLKAISNLPYDSIYPFGQTVAVAALINKDVEVAEAGVRAFENWGSKDGVSVLEGTKLSYDWLELYRQQTVAYLRDI